MDAGLLNARTLIPKVLEKVVCGTRVANHLPEPNTLCYLDGPSPVYPARTVNLIPRDTWLPRLPSTTLGNTLD
jgi:hypothetical protein